jgi:hypothetical protein
MESNNIFEIKSTMEGEVNIQEAFYAVDFTKMNSVNDLVLILAAMGLTFHTTHPHFNSVKRFLALDNPIVPPTVQPAPKQVKLELPKLNKV